jgi:hypothetical protein
MTEENFESILMSKYPDLFYKKEDGTLDCPCGAWVPEGWRAVVYELCGAIDNYIKYTSTVNRRVLNCKYYFWNTLRAAIQSLHYLIIHKLCKKLNKHQFNQPCFKLNRTLTKRATKHVAYDKIHPPAVKIDQIKEKFGELRFYYSGGDPSVSGMVIFAEYLCRQTCEVSGEKGELCVRGSWFKTLSPKATESDIYKGYSPVNKNKQ